MRAVGTVAGVVVMRGRPMGKTPGFSNQMSIRRHLAQHARSDRTPDGEQYSQKDEEPDAKGFHFFMLPPGAFFEFQGQSPAQARIGRDHQAFYRSKVK